MLDQQIKPQIKSSINRSKVRSTDQMLDQQIKNKMNRSKVGSTDQIIDQKIKKNRSTDKKMYLRCNLDEIKMQFRCNIYATYQQIKS